MVELSETSGALAPERRIAVDRLGALVDLLVRASQRIRLDAAAAGGAPSPMVTSDIGDDADDSAGALSYLQEVRAQARLSAEDEVAFFRAARDSAASAHARETARRQVVRANLWVVPIIVRRFYRSGPGFDDLVAEGNIGLYRAFDRFDPKRGFRFSTYAKWWVIDAVTNAMAANAYPVRVPRKVALAQRRLGEDRAVPASAAGGTDTAAIEELGVEAAWPAESVEAAIEFDELTAPLSAEPLPDQIVALRQALSLLSEAVAALPVRERRVIEGRYGLNGQRERTLQDLGDELGVTAERVRTLQLSAMDKLKQAMRPLMSPEDETGAERPPAEAAVTPRTARAPRR